MPTTTNQLSALDACQRWMEAYLGYSQPVPAELLEQAEATAFTDENYSPGELGLLVNDDFKFKLSEVDAYFGGSAHIIYDCITSGLISVNKGYISEEGCDTLIARFLPYKLELVRYVHYWMQSLE